MIDEVLGQDGTSVLERHGTGFIVGLFQVVLGYPILLVVLFKLSSDDFCERILCSQVNGQLGKNNWAGLQRQGRTYRTGAANRAVVDASLAVRYVVHDLRQTDVPRSSISASEMDRKIETKAWLDFIEPISSALGWSPAQVGTCADGEIRRRWWNFD